MPSRDGRCSIPGNGACRPGLSLGQRAHSCCNPCFVCERTMLFASTVRSCGCSLGLLWVSPRVRLLACCGAGRGTRTHRPSSRVKGGSAPGRQSTFSSRAPWVSRPRTLKAGLTTAPPTCLGVRPAPRPRCEWIKAEHAPCTTACNLNNRA